MSRRPDLVILRNKAICARYRKYASVMEHGKPKYNFDWIMQELSQRHFFLVPELLWRIIRDEPKGGYDSIESTSQLNIFEDEKTDS